MNTVIITGSAGLVGSACVKKFHDEGWNVVGVDNGMRSEFFGTEKRTAQFDYDICDSGAINEIFDECMGNYLSIDMDTESIDAVIHCAAQPSHDWAASNPQMDFAINATGTLNVLEAARKYAPEAPFVFCSTNKVYGDEPNRWEYEEGKTRYLRYSGILTTRGMAFDNTGFNESMPIDRCMHSVFGASKLAADIMVQEYGRYFGMPTVCFRGGCLTGAAHAGAEQHGFLAYLMKCAREGRKYRIYGYGGKQVRDNIHAYDLADAFWAFVQRPSCGAVYNIGGGPERSVSVIEAIAKAEMYTSRPMDVEYVDEARKGDHKWWVTDVSKFRRDYPEWDYKWSLDQIFEEMANA